MCDVQADAGCSLGTLLRARNIANDVDGIDVNHQAESGDGK
jgi:hypothetical protein